MANIENLRQTVLNAALPLIEARGIVLWGLEIVPGPVLVVRLYVDGGEEDIAGIDDCEAISRQLGLALEVEDPIDQPWTLEISTPGLERKFFSLMQMRPYIGDIVDIRLLMPCNGRKHWRGRLLAITGDTLELEPCEVSAAGEILPENAPIAKLGWPHIAHARRVHIFAAPGRPGGKSAKKHGKQGSR